MVDGHTPACLRDRRRQRGACGPADDYLNCLKNHGVDYTRPNKGFWFSLGEVTVTDLRSGYYIRDQLVAGMIKDGVGPVAAQAVADCSTQVMNRQ